MNILGDIFFRWMFFHVLEGKEQMEVGGEKKEVCKDKIVYSPAKKYIVGIISQNNPLRIMVAKIPKPIE